MHLRTRLFASLLLFLAVPAALPAADRTFLPLEVERVLAQRRIPGTSLSIFVREIGRDEPLVSYNAAVPRNPASTMKVLTTYAALELLGPAFTWRTRAFATGPVRDRVLEGNLVLVGAPEKPLPVAALPLIFRRRSFSGSLIGGLPETQEMLDFCGKHNITSDIEMIRRRIEARNHEFMSPKLLDSQFATLERPEPDENILAVSIEDPIETIASKVVKQLGHLKVFKRGQ